LVRAARTWHSGGRESSELYRGARLSIALDWAAEHSTDLNESERAFLAASREAAESDAEEQRRANRRLRVLLTGAVVLLVVAVAAGAIAVVQRGSARRSATRASAAATAALAQKLGAQAIAQPRIDVAMLLAREAIALDPTVQTRDELLTTLLRVPSAVRTYHWNSDRNGDLRLTPDGRTLAIADNNGNWIWRDTASGRELRRNRDALLAFAPDGSAIDGARGQPLVVREPGTYAVVRSIDAPPFARSWDPGVVGFADGGHTAVVTFTRNVDTGTGPQAQQARVLRVDLDTGRWGRPVVLDKANKGLALLPGGRLALVDDPTTAVVVDTVTGRTTRRYAVTGGFVAVSPNGRTAALPRDDGAMQFLDLRSGQVQVGIDRSQAARMVFTPDGGTLVVGGEDGTVQVWSVGDHKVTKTFAGHAGPVHALAMSPDGTTVYSGSFDTDVVAWDLTGTRGVAQTYSGGDADPALDAWTLAIAPDGHTAAEAGAHGDVVLSDLVTHRQVARFSTGNGVVSATTYSPDGRELLVSKDPIQPSPNPKTWLQIWALAPQPHIVRTFDTSGWKFLTWSTWSRDGSTVAATGLLRGQTFDTGGAVAEWDARTGRPLGAPLLVKGGYPVVVAFAPHGRVVGVGGYAISSIVADPSRGKVLATMRGSNERFSYQEGIAFSPDGTQLATAQWDGTIRLWDSRTGRQLVKIQDSAQGVVEGVAWSPDGKTLAATDWTPSLHLYDVSSHQQLGSSIPLPVLPAPLNYSPWVQFTPDGSKVVVNGTNDETVVVPITLSALANEACRVAGRSFTREEWAQYVPARPYQPVCPAS
jgi:WD40 repeat protein